MSQAPRESLHQIFRDLHAERVRTFDPAVLQINIDQRKTLVDTADRSQFIQVGDALPPFSLREVDGGEMTLDGLVRGGPAVILFFRFEGCPACNLALPYYQRNLWPSLKALDVELVAVSPQVPGKLAAIKRRHSLEYSVASDLGNELGRKLGILYTFDAASQRSAIEAGRPIGDVTGTGTWELPMPTVIVVDQSRVARFVDVHPDWLVRTEAEPIIAAVSALRDERAQNTKKQAGPRATALGATGG